MLKSRSSDSFTSQPKDFIAPIDDRPAELRPGHHPEADRPGAGPEHDPVRLHEVVPDRPDDGPDLLPHRRRRAGLRRHRPVRHRLHRHRGPRRPSAGTSSASTARPAAASRRRSHRPPLTFAIDSSDDVLDCTYTNAARAELTVVKVADAAGDFDFTSDHADPVVVHAVDRPRPVCPAPDSRDYDDLPPGTYDLAETVSAGPTGDPPPGQRGLPRPPTRRPLTSSPHVPPRQDLGAIQITKPARTPPTAPVTTPTPG